MVSCSLDEKQFRIANEVRSLDNLRIKLLFWLNLLKVRKPEDHAHTWLNGVGLRPVLLYWILTQLPEKASY